MESMKQYGVQRRSPYDLGEDTEQWAGGSRDAATSWDSAATSANGLRAWGSRVQASGAFPLEHSRGVWGHGLGG